MGKKLVAARDLPQATSSAGRHRREVARRRGLPPYELDALLGRTLARPLAAEQDVAVADFEPADRPVGAREA